MEWEAGRFTQLDVGTWLVDPDLVPRTRSDLYRGQLQRRIDPGSGLCAMSAAEISLQSLSLALLSQLHSWCLAIFCFYFVCLGLLGV